MTALAPTPIASYPDHRAAWTAALAAAEASGPGTPLTDDEIDSTVREWLAHVGLRQSEAR